MGKNKNKNDDGKQSPGGGVKVAGVNVGKTFNAADIAAIQTARPNISVAAIQQKAKDADVKIKSSAKSVFRAEAQKFADVAKKEEIQRQKEILQGLGVLSESGQPIYGSASSNLPGEEIVSSTTFDLAKEGAELKNAQQISNYGWDKQEAIANIQRAGAYERIKYEVDNKIPLAQEEARGKIDLQKIVNAGYKNIANIERGSAMVNAVTSMFNF